MRLIGAPFISFLREFRQKNPASYYKRLPPEREQPAGYCGSILYKTDGTVCHIGYYNKNQYGDQYAADNEQVSYIFVF